MCKHCYDSWRWRQNLAINRAKEEQRRLRRQADPIQRVKLHRYARAWRLQKDFGITIEEYTKLLEDQRGLCAICQAPPRSRRLAVDHDHAVNKVRGLLCMNCNRGIGYLRDSIKLLEAGIAYLKKWSRETTRAK